MKIKSLFKNVILIETLRLVNVLFPKIIKSIYVSSGNKHEYFFSYFANNWVREIHFKPSLFVDNQKKKASLSKLHWCIVKPFNGILTTHRILISSDSSNYCVLNSSRKNAQKYRCLIPKTHIMPFVFCLCDKVMFDFMLFYLFASILSYLFKSSHSIMTTDILIFKT